MKLLDIYSYLISNWLNSGAFVSRGKMQALSLKPAYNLIFTKSKVKKIIQINGIKPINLDIDFVNYIRDRLFELHPDIKTIITISNYPTKLDVMSDTFRRSMNRAVEAYSTYKEVFDSLSGVNRLAGKSFRLPNGGRLRITKEKLDTLEQVEKSHTHLYRYVTEGGTLSLTKIFVELIGETPRDVKRAEQTLYGILGSINVGSQAIKSINKSYLNTFAPAVTSPKALHKKFLPQLLFSEQDSSAFSPYKARGLSGGGKNALLLGMDYRSRLPLSVDLFKTSSAQNFLISGKTGSGKTYASYQLALSALIHNIQVTAIDIKGKEWSKLAPLVSGCKVISFDSESSSIVNTLRLDDLPLSILNPKDEYEAAIRGTIQLFLTSIDLQPDEGSPVDATMILREAIQKVYSLKGVDPNNPSSFALTKEIKYADIFPILESLQTSASYSPSQKALASLIRSRLSVYYSDTGLFAESLQNELSLAEILEAPLVVYEFNKNQNSNSTLDAIRFAMIAQLDLKKKSIRRAQGLFTLSIYEELQRLNSFLGLIDYLIADVTGGRSNNSILCLLMNSLKILQGPLAQDIRSNITGFIVGASEANDIASYAEDFNRPWVAGQLALFESKPNLFRNCFCASIDTGSEVIETIYRVELPPEISEQFRTRTIKV